MTVELDGAEGGGKVEWRQGGGISGKGEDKMGGDPTRMWWDQLQQCRILTLTPSLGNLT